MKPIIKIAPIGLTVPTGLMEKPLHLITVMSTRFMEKPVTNVRNLLAGTLALTALAAAGCGGSSDASGGSSSDSGGAKGTLSLVAYSTPQVVYDEIIPAFKKTDAGNGIGFKESFGASGDQSRAVVAGQPADVVAFSLSPDMNKLADAGLVSKTWADTPTKGMVSDSVVVFVVRKGNPKGIRTWDDLLKPGVDVLTPNPFSSGGAKWNLMAAYGAKSDAGQNPAAGLAYVKSLLTDHVKVQDKSGRESLQNFLNGNGDVALSYENEAITAQKKGSKIDYVVPDQTIRIENPIAATTKSKDPAAAKAFVDYALSKPGQEVFASWGYRPVDASVLKANASTFPTPSGLFTIDDLGGWSKVNDSFFDVDKGSIAKIEEDAGVSTSK
ncbi:MAG: sulfate transporter, periplasmic sulfate-binding protein [Solirubrobacterales bacterium]|nr:sulfate transporter, periplasmic sulfate-binding protein [Solirubrobacterales bacterium]